ncbi:hypothetical protein TWF718_006062 [Orbilia javanica]|uniref:Aminoglycoside phosphotransferase domain-containing protein n=1 Tax=Orbilia javanica TaxID=47235 RepID=A0AAN8N8R5_9PEZI
MPHSDSPAPESASFPDLPPSPALSSSSFCSSSSSSISPEQQSQLDKNFTNMSPANSDEAIKRLTDDELKSFISDLRDHIRGSQKGHYQKCTRVIRISQGYVTKSYGENWGKDAIAGIELARELGVRVPAIERILEYNEIDDKGFEIVQQYVPGKTLKELWTDLSLEETIRLAFQLRGMLRIMHQKTNDCIGSCYSLKCRTYYLESELGLPRACKAEEIGKVVNFWSNYEGLPKICWVKKSVEEHERACAIGPVSLDCPAVFTHHDLAPRNMIVDPKGDLWLVDWDYAGWYPAYFDRASMDHFMLQFGEWSSNDRLRWDIFCSIATESKWEEQAKAVNTMLSWMACTSGNHRIPCVQAGVTLRDPQFSSRME